ncbi:MAG: hypothetical protein QXE81_01415 [Desulfurococcaceae archaeon]
MSIATATKCLLKNTWFLSSSGFKHGYVFINGSRIDDTNEGESPPEYELAELVYDFQGDSVVAHGYSIVTDIVEYTTRGLDNIDLSVFTREELRKLAKVGVVNAYINGVTLPVTITNHPEIIIDIARENSIRIGLIVDRGVVSKNPFTVLFEVEENWVYYEDRKISEMSKFICQSSMLSNECLIIDGRGYGNLSTAIEEVFKESGNFERAFKLLTNTYRLAGIDNGFVDNGSSSDIIIYDLKNPLKSLPIRDVSNLYKLLSRSQQPDIVFIGGDVFYDHGENLAIAIVKIHELFKKKLTIERNNIQ